jgi:hypothetical protein
MPTLIVNSTEYNVPEDYSIGKWTELLKWSANENKLISLAYGLPPSVIDRMSPETKHLALCFIVGTLYPSYQPINRSVKGHTLINFSEIKLGQFIDLEVYIGRDYVKHIKEIISILYQTQVTDDWFIGDVYGALQSYFKWRITLYNSYKNLFNIENNIEDEVDDYHDSKIDVAHVWYDTIMILADGKFINIENVTEKPLVEALNYLAWHKTKIEREAEALRLAKAQIK